MIYIFLPAYNEEHALPILVKKFAEAFKGIGDHYRFVVLDAEPDQKPDYDRVETS